VPKPPGLRRLAGKENAPGGEGNVSDQEPSRRRLSVVVVPAAGPSAAPPAVAVARVVVVLVSGRAPAVAPARAVAPAPAAVPGHRRGRPCLARVSPRFG
jgi:hypothetical protein